MTHAEGWGGSFLYQCGPVPRKCVGTLRPWGFERILLICQVLAAVLPQFLDGLHHLGRENHCGISVLRDLGYGWGCVVDGIPPGAAHCPHHTDVAFLGRCCAEGPPRLHRSSGFPPAHWCWLPGRLNCPDRRVWDVIEPTSFITVCPASLNHSCLFPLMAMYMPVTDVSCKSVASQLAGMALLVPGSTPGMIRVMVDPVSSRSQQGVSSTRQLTYRLLALPSWLTLGAITGVGLACAAGGTPLTAPPTWCFLVLQGTVLEQGSCRQCNLVSYTQGEFVGTETCFNTTWRLLHHPHQAYTLPIMLLAPIISLPHMHAQTQADRRRHTHHSLLQITLNTIQYTRHHDTHGKGTTDANLYTPFYIIYMADPGPACHAAWGVLSAL